MLIIADIHFGKAAAFRAHGIPVPSGTTTDNLQRLDALIAAYEVAHIVFLGDFLHARAGRAIATLQALQAWRSRHPALQLTLVRGNHDSHAGDPPAELNIDVVDEPFACAPFSFCHHPELPHNRASGYVLAGHLHPVFRIRSSSDALRLPCFVFGPNGGVLPSFGAFTGGFTIDGQSGERIFVIAEDVVIQIPV